MDRDVSMFGPVLGGLLAPERVMPLGPGAPHEASLASLKALTVQGAFADRKIVDHDMARAVLAGVWLYHDFLDESHEISQGIETPTGSYWHGVLHRREPDYPNAGYWFRRVGRHPVFDSLGAEASRLGLGAGWDPFQFIDLCEKAAAQGGAMERACREAQMVEWWALLEFSYRHALDGSLSDPGP